MRHRAFLPFILILLLSFIIPGCDKKQVRETMADPFPGEILNHRVFRVFRSENRLGWTYRDESRQIFGDMMWVGQESTTGGEDKVITYTRSQAAALTFRFPSLGALNYGGSAEQAHTFRVILKGLKVHELKTPFVNPEFSGEPDIPRTPFVISMISVDKIVVQVFDKNGASIGAGVSFLFSGDVRYSEQLSGSVAADNVFIGYISTMPTSRDISRKADPGFLNRQGSDLIRLAVFEPENRTNELRFNWLPHSMQNKLEEAFLRIPKFFVLINHKDDARYKLTGIITMIGKRPEITLTLYDSLKNEQLQKLTTLIRTDNIDELYDYQIKVINKFVEPFGVIIDKKDREKVRNAVESGKDITIEKMLGNGWISYNSQHYQEAESIGRKIYARDPHFIDGLNLMAWSLHQLGKYDEAIEFAQQLAAEAQVKKDDLWLAKAYDRIGNEYRFTKDYTRAIDYLGRAAKINEKLLGPNHQYTLFSYQGLALSYGSVNQTDKAIEIYLKTLDILIKSLGADHTTVGTTYLSIGSIYSLAKNYDAALEYLFKAVQIQKKHLQAMHPDIANSYRWIGTTYYYQGNYPMSERYYLDTMNIYESLFGPNHPDSKSAYAWLDSIYQKLGNEEKAKYYRGKK